MSEPTPLHKWADAIEACIEANTLTTVDRVAVFAETMSTQDTAQRMAASRPGLLVIAAHQSEGRGRLGKTWCDDPDHSLAMTLALDSRKHSPAFLALASGVAVAEACAKLLPADTLGLKWPNDIVERRTNRKLAGILVESADPLALIGIGANVSHTRQQLDDSGLVHAASLADLGAAVDRIATAERILIELDRALHRPEADLAQAWRRRDTLTGTHQTLTHNGKRYEGVVESIDPTLTLVVRTRDGIHRLPALSTSVADRGATA